MACGPHHPSVMVSHLHQPASVPARLPTLQLRLCGLDEYQFPACFAFPRSLAIGPDSDQYDSLWDAGKGETQARQVSIML